MLRCVKQPASLRNYRASASANRQCSYDEHTDHRGLGNGCTRTGACAAARNLAEVRAPGCVIALRVASAEAFAPQDVICGTDDAVAAEIAGQSRCRVQQVEV